MKDTAVNLIFYRLDKIGFYWQSLMLAALDSYVADIEAGKYTTYRYGFYDRACSAYHHVEPFLTDLERQVLKQWLSDRHAAALCITEVAHV